jgi:site-specific recombinase XerD
MDKSRGSGQELWKYIRSYLTVYLPKIRGLSSRTIESYRESISMYCLFLKEDSRIDFSKTSFDHVTRDSVMKFVQSLRKRGCGASTCNLRLSSLKSLLKYCADEDIGLYSVYQDVRRVPLMKVTRMPVQYMSETAVKALLVQPDPKTAKGMRNRMIMILLYDAGVRVQELVDLKVSDLQLQAKNPFTIVTGKGSKTRSVPLMDKTVTHLREYLRRFHSRSDDGTREPLFFSTRSGAPHKLSTDAVGVMLKNYARSARKTCSEVPERVHPHLFRHTRAMDLYRAGMPLSYVAEFLGHVNLNTTDIYASADVEMLREALEKADPELAKEIPLWKDKESLKTLCGL